MIQCPLLELTRSVVDIMVSNNLLLNYCNYDGPALVKWWQPRMSLRELRRLRLLRCDCLDSRNGHSFYGGMATAAALAVLERPFTALYKGGCWGR